LRDRAGKSFSRGCNDVMPLSWPQTASRLNQAKIGRARGVQDHPPGGPSPDDRITQLLPQLLRRAGPTPRQSRCTKAGYTAAHVYPPIARDQLGKKDGVSADYKDGFSSVLERTERRRKWPRKQQSSCVWRASASALTLPTIASRARLLRVDLRQLQATPPEIACPREWLSGTTGLCSSRRRPRQKRA